MLLSNFAVGKHLIELAGLRVKVAKTSTAYHGDYKNAEGLVVKPYEGNVGVKLDNLSNNQSGYGLFYFRTNDLELIDSKNMEVTNEMALSGDYKVATVKFPTDYGYSGAAYDFALYPTEEVSVGDCVLVNSKTGYSVAVVDSICSKKDADQLPTKEVICKVDFTNFDARKKAREDKKKLKKKMDEMLAKSQELVLFQMLAEKNPEMAEMLEEYKNLGNV